MQEQFLVQRLFSAFLKRKMESEMDQHYVVEDAFQKIRTATGYSDVNEIVHRFLTREQTYSQLLMAVSENERKIDNLRYEHEILGTRLHDLQMDDNADQQNQENKPRIEDKPHSPEIDELDKEIIRLTKEKELSDELNRKVELVYDQVEGWCSRVINKVDQQFNSNIGVFEGTKTLEYRFKEIAKAVTQQLTEIIRTENQDEELGYITAKDFMNDFATQDFLDKNIRVRPVSGVTRGDDEGKTNDPFNKSMGGDDVEDYEKFEQMRVLEMQDQRIQAKALRDEFLRKKALEEEKLNKKKK